MPVAARTLRRADHSFRGVLSTMRVCLWSRNFNNETTYTRAGLLRYRKNKIFVYAMKTDWLISVDLLCIVCWEKYSYIWRCVVVGSTLRTEIGLAAPPPLGQNVWARRDTTVMMKTYGLQTEIDSAERHQRRVQISFLHNNKRIHSDAHTSRQLALSIFTEEIRNADKTYLWICEVFTALLMRIKVFCNMTPCRLVIIHRSFEESCCLQMLGSPLFLPYS